MREFSSSVCPLDGRRRGGAAFRLPFPPTFALTSTDRRGSSGSPFLTAPGGRAPFIPESTAILYAGAMALSQIQCLDNNNVNRRTNESKPEFFYSEDQRLALEALIEDGRDAFELYIKAHAVRGFLSDVELQRLAATAQVYDPGSERVTRQAEGDGDDAAAAAASSLQYWPERSEYSVPELDMGWPDCVSFRGVTRVSVYMQPPMEGQAHIKEVVRKTIAQAQKVIAVVMDLFTDVDIFNDLLDAAFKRKVAVYVILEASSVPHFLNMCRRSRMHKGHLKNLRVRCSRGMEFYTHSARKVFGSLGQKFMFVDGDRAVSGSYSFTWTASRLDRNLITVLTGQAVETFDKQFRDLYSVSQSVDLSEVNMEDEPEPEPVIAPILAPVSADVARKRINPKYSLVSNNLLESEDKTTSEKNKVDKEPVAKTRRPPREMQEPIPAHPGLLNLERVSMIPYLPTWPEPDPPGDIIGFINIRDSNKPVRAHLMRSELFETSQAIRFKDPFVLLEEPLPEKTSHGLRPTKDAAVAAQCSQNQKRASLQKEEALPESESVEQALDERGSPISQNSGEIQSPFQGTHNDPKKETQTLDQSHPLFTPEQKETRHHGSSTEKSVQLRDRTVSIISLEPEQIRFQRSGCLGDQEPKSRMLNSRDIPGKQDTVSHPVPKPRTIHLVIDASSGKDVSVVKCGQLSEKRPGPLAQTSEQASDTSAKHDRLTPTTVAEEVTLSNSSETCLNTDEQKVKQVKVTESPRKGSIVSTTSEEYFECADSAHSELKPELLATGAQARSVRMEEAGNLRRLEATSVVAWSSPEPQPEKEQQPDGKREAQTDMCIEAEGEQNPTIQNSHGDEKKQHCTSPLCPASGPLSVQQDHEQGGTKAGENGPKRTRRITKANRSNNRAYVAHRTSAGDPPAQMGGSQGFPFKLAQEQQVKPKAGRLSGQRRFPRRHSVAWGDSRASFGIPIASLSHFTNLRRKIPGIPLETLRKPVRVPAPALQEQCL